MQGVVGCFLNTILLRARCSGTTNIRELLQQVRDITVGAYAHQTIPFEEVANKLGDRDLTHSLSSRVVFGLRNSPSTYQQIPGITWERVPLERGTTKFELEVQLIHKDGSLSGFADYATRLFAVQTIRDFLQEFQTILLHIVRDEEITVQSLLANLPSFSNESKPMTDHSISSPRRKAFKDFKTAPVKVSADELVHTSTLNGNVLPLVVTAAVQGIDLADWIQTNEKTVRAYLRTHGGVLFQGFSVNTTEYFQRVVNAYSPQLMEYTERSTPRTKVNGNVYTSTEYPADQSIPLHNENSYSHVWPEKIWFLCMQAAESGGETPVADSRQILKVLDPQIVHRFTEKQVMYVRNFREGLGLSWQEAFQTSEPSTVERYCQKSGIQFEWVSSGHLRTRQVRPAVIQHPETGESVWFNQAHLFHFSSLDEKLRRSMLALYREEDLPRTAYYGDGAEIEPEALTAIHNAYQQASVVFPWKAGDLLLLDNILTAHGRRPYAGARKIVVMMSEPSTQHMKTYTAHQQEI
jgi:alpha-ketoglutarate-dependent taurine dioxygenase